MFWKPAKALGLVVGLAILLTIAAVSVSLLHSILAQGPGMSAFVTGVLFILSVPLLALWARWYYGLATLRYYLDRNVLVIVRGATRFVVPLGEIRSVVRGDEVAMSESFRGVGWPGYLTGVAQSRELGPVLTNSTEPLERQVVVVTARGCYGISPREPQRFLDELASYLATEPPRRVPQRTLLLPIAAHPLWRDRWFWLTMGAALVANVALFGLVSSRYGVLPDRFPIYLTPQREAYRIIARTEIYFVPAIGSLLLVLNGALGALLHRRERLGAYLMAAMSVVLQVPLWAAVSGMLGG